jgi:hypothetical protein
MFELDPGFYDPVHACKPIDLLDDRFYKLRGELGGRVHSGDKYAEDTIKILDDKVRWYQRLVPSAKLSMHLPELEAGRAAFIAQTKPLPPNPALAHEILLAELHSARDALGRAIQFAERMEGAGRTT